MVALNQFPQTDSPPSLKLTCGAGKCAISSVVERFIDIEEAGSSILPSRT